MTVSTRKGQEQVEALIRRHVGGVRNYLLYLGCPPHLADDLVQETFLSFCRGRFEFRGEAATAAFLRKVARHLFLKAMRRERRQPLAMDPEGAEAAWVEFEGQDEGRGYLTALRECLRALVGRASEVVHLRYRDGLRRGIIAERLGMTENGVKSVLVRTRQRLRECVERRVG